MDSRRRHAAGRAQRRTPLLLELGIATMVITPGEAVRKQAIERFRLKPDRVGTVREAAACDAPGRATPWRGSRYPAANRGTLSPGRRQSASELPDSGAFLVPYARQS